MQKKDDEDDKLADSANLKKSGTKGSGYWNTLKALASQKKQKRNHEAELKIANIELAFQVEEKGKRTIELALANTELVKAREKLIKANRLNSFISQVNQNIVRVEDEGTLFRNACHIALGFGKFRMAWIGMFDSTGKKITLVDQSGIPGEDIHLFINAPLQSKGPQDYVLRTENYYVCNDVQHDLELEGWKPVAAKHDICSIMVLPIQKSGTIIGTFNLYSTELGYFNKEAIKLMVELTGDISFALDLFEKEKKQGETDEQIINNENRFRALIENGSDMKTLTTKEGRVLYGSPSIEKSLGYTAKEYLLIYPSDLIHPDDLPGYLEKRNEITQTPGNSFHFVQRRKHKNGYWLWCEGTITNMLSEPAIHAMVSNFRDVSEKKISDNIREFDKNNLDALINSTQDLMWSVDRDYNLITSNIPFDDITRFITGSVIPKGSNILEVGFSPEQLIRYKKLYQRAFAGETFTEIEYSQVPTELWLEITYNPIRNGEEIIGTACHSRDITVNKRAEESLLLTQFAIDNAGDAIFWMTPEARIVNVNDAACRLLGYSREELLQLSIPDIDPASNKQAWSVHFAEVRRKGSLIFETVQQAKDGLMIPVEVRANYIKFGDRELNCAFIRNITERKKAEENLKKSEARLNEAQAISHICNWEIDLRTNVSMWSDEFCQIFGVAGDVIIPFPEIFLSFAHPGDYNFVKDTMDSALKNFARTSFSSRILTTDGVLKYIYTEARFEFDDQGKAVRIYGTFHDVTENKLAELKLKQSEIRFREFFESAPETIVIYDLTDHTFVKFNDNALKLLKYSAEELLKKGPVDISPEFQPDGRSSKDKAMEFNTSAMKGDKPVFEWLFLDANGKEVLCEVRLATLSNIDSPQLLGSFIDITERKNEEKERERSSAEIVQRNKDLEQFSYIISHNLRAPVANIMGIADALRTLEPDENEREELIFNLTASVSKLNGVILDLNNILQAKRSVSEKREMLSFSHLVKNIRISISELIKKEQVVINTDFSKGDKFFTLKSYLYSIFYNLISNSIKYRQQDISPVIEVTSFSKGNKIEIHFKDNGLGIDLEKKGDQVFGLYKRFHNHTEGKGMGLYMVKTQVEALGGKISIQSEVNKGTTFVLEFETEKVNPS